MFYIGMLHFFHDVTSTFLLNNSTCFRNSEK